MRVMRVSTFSFVIAIALSLICIGSFYYTNEIVQSDFKHRKNIAELDQVYDSLVEKVSESGISQHKAIELIELARESDIANYRFLASMTQTLNSEMKLLLCLLALQSVIVFSLWRRSSGLRRQ